MGPHWELQEQKQPPWEDSGPGYAGPGFGPIPVHNSPTWAPHLLQPCGGDTESPAVSIPWGREDQACEP